MKKILEYGIGIAGAGHHLPGKFLPNDYIEKLAQVPAGTIEEKTGIKVFIRNKKNNAGNVTFEYKDLDQLNRLIMVIKTNY